MDGRGDRNGHRPGPAGVVRPYLVLRRHVDYCRTATAICCHR
ncbi:hypothetical protein [Pseudonocardia sp. NPDC046786]